MDLSNVSRRLEAVRKLARLSKRGMDKVAGRPTGTCAIIEGKEQQSVRHHVATSYAEGLRISVEWLMSGCGPIVEGRPELDLDQPNDRALLAEYFSAALAQGEAGPTTNAPGVVPAARKKPPARRPATRRTTPPIAAKQHRAAS
jgi:hypothetical protein